MLIPSAGKKKRNQKHPELCCKAMEGDAVFKYSVFESCSSSIDLNMSKNTKKKNVDSF